MIRPNNGAVYLFIIIFIATIQKNDSFIQIHNTNLKHVTSKQYHVNEKQSKPKSLPRVSSSHDIRKMTLSPSQKTEGLAEEEGIGMDLNPKYTEKSPIWTNLAIYFMERIYPSDQLINKDVIAREKLQKQIVTILRVGVPSIIYGIIACLIFPSLALGLARILSDDKVFYVLSTDSSQYIQNALTVVGLLFSILVGQTYYFMYQQQENVYFALFREVTEAKSLLEQVALVCQGRSMYPQVLSSIQRYVKNDLMQLQADPAVLLSRRPIDDPLESVMYMTSVGVPSSVYETVRSLRQARAERLGALQRKLPKVHLLLLWILAGMELLAFPFLGAGTQSIAGYRILTIEAVLFGVMTSGVVMTLRVVAELWRPAGGAYNVDTVLSVMVKGLDEELQMRIKGIKTANVYRSQKRSPTEFNVVNDETSDMQMQSKVKNERHNFGSNTEKEVTVMQQQGASLGFRKMVKSFLKWLVH